MLTRHLRGGLLAALAGVCLVASALPSGAEASSTSHHKKSHNNHVRNFDHHLHHHANHARKNNGVHHYPMNHKLWKVANNWAQHLAKHGVLEHDPNLATKIGNKCPNWTDMGENVGVETGENSHQLFKAYMADPDHRANILDKHYKEVGIASVKVKVGGLVQDWDVMDFANHC
jgi:uncharacterized protein YkwD